MMLIQSGALVNTNLSQEDDTSTPLAEIDVAEIIQNTDSRESPRSYQGTRIPVQTRWVQRIVA
jgi:hypothetical protein